MHLCVLRLTNQLLLIKICNRRVLPAFYFSTFINFDVSFLNGTRLTLSFCLNFNKKTVALTSVLVSYKLVTCLEVTYFMSSRTDKLPSVVLCSDIC